MRRGGSKPQYGGSIRCGGWDTGRCTINPHPTNEPAMEASAAVSGPGTRQGTATDADALGGVAAANYLRSDSADTTTGRISVQSDDGIRLGGGNDITMSLSSDNFTIAQTTQDKDIIFTVNDGGTTTTLMTLDGDTGRLELPSVGDLRVKGNLIDTHYGEWFNIWNNFIKTFFCTWIKNINI